MVNKYNREYFDFLVSGLTAEQSEALGDIDSKAEITYVDGKVSDINDELILIKATQDNTITSISELDEEQDLQDEDISSNTSSIEELTETKLDVDVYENEKSEQDAEIQSNTDAIADLVGDAHTHDNIDALDRFGLVGTSMVTVNGRAIIDDNMVIDQLVSTLKNRPLSANQGKVLKGMIDNINVLLTSDDTTLDEIQEIVDFIKQNKETLDTLGITNIAGLQDALDLKADKSTVQEIADDVDQIELDVDTNATMIEENANDIDENTLAISTHADDKNNPHEVTAKQVGLGMVDNTSDEDKPISIATQTALDRKADTRYVDNQDALLLDEINNIKTILASDDTTLDELQEVVDFIKQNKETLDALGISNIAGLQDALDGKASVAMVNAVLDIIDDHTANKDNPHEVTAKQVGLGMVDDTSDEDKPVSSAQKAYIDAGDLNLQNQIATNDQDIDDLNAKLSQTILNSKWQYMISGGGAINFSGDVLTTTKRFIMIPTNSNGSSSYINFNISGLVVANWQIAYVDFTDEQLSTSSLNVTKDDVTVTSYSSYTNVDNPNRIVIGYKNGDAQSFVFSNGQAVPSGIWTRLENTTLNRHVYTNSVNKTFGYGNAVTLFTTDTYNIKGGRDFNIFLSLPLRSDSQSWGGAYININVKINGTWYNLGNGGYDGNIMHYKARSISTWIKSLDVFVNSVLGIHSNYTVQVEVTARSYNTTVRLNGSHDINRTANNLGVRGAVQGNLAGNQNWATVKVTEIPGVV